MKKHYHLFYAILAVSFGVSILFSNSLYADQHTNKIEPYGLWLTKNERSAVKTFPCPDNDKTLCGSIAWIIEGGMKYDSKNPDESLRTKPMCGLQILSAFSQNKKEPKKWDDGKIYKADDGDLYSANLQVIDENRLRVHGYVGIPLFGKTQVWTRVSSDEYPPCSPPKLP